MDLPRASHPRVRPLHTEQARVRRCGLIIIHEVAYLPFEQGAASLFFHLVSTCCENALPILTSNLPFARWSSRFGDKVVAVATIDGIVHHADVVTLKGFEWDWAPT
jgi:DNA replication protein DnaC